MPIKAPFKGKPKNMKLSDLTDWNEYEDTHFTHKISAGYTPDSVF
jgi:hypothetical protein